MLIPFEDVTCIHFLNYIIETGIIAVSYYTIALLFESIKIIHHLTTKEGSSIFERGLIDDDLGAFGFDALHDALDGTLAEIVGITLHGQAIDTDSNGLLTAIVLVVGAIGIPAGLAKDFVGNEVLTGAVALDNGGHHVLGHIGIVGQELLGVLGEAIAAITKRGVVVVGANAGVETNARNNGLGIEAFDLGIGVELVEVADTKCQIRVSK